MERIIGRLPSIPEYYAEHINPKADLDSQPKQCCPFHHENTPSFSYSPAIKTWRCFGSCKTGGDVIDLFMKHKNIKSREEAKKLLDKMYGVRYEQNGRLVQPIVIINYQTVEIETAIQEALLVAGERVDRWLDLDYVISQTPIDYQLVKDLVGKWRDG